MKLYTEKEYNNQTKHLAFRLRNLYLKNKDEFYLIQEFLPSPVYINERTQLNYHYANDAFFSKGKEVENIKLLGKSYLETVSNRALLKNALALTKQFHFKDDYNDVCNYLQCLSLNNTMTPYFTNKVLIDDNLTLNTSIFPSDDIIIKRLFKELVPFGEGNLNDWLRYQELTKREKEVLKLIAHDNSNKDVADMLFISEHSVKTHRRNIYKKLDLHSTSQLVRIALAMELLR